MQTARPTRYLRPLLAIGLLLGFIIVSWTLSPSGALFALQRAGKSAKAAVQPHERVEGITQALEQAQRRKGASRVYTVSESEINSYIGHKMTQQPVKGMKSLVVNLHDANRLTATALIDFNQVKLSNEGLMASAFKKIMTGDHYLKMNGTLSSGQHRGQFVVTGAEMGGVPIPNSLVQAIIRHVGAKQHPPVDLTQPFALPYGIERVEISTGTVRVKT